MFCINVMNIIAPLKAQYTPYLRSNFSVNKPNEIKSNSNINFNGLFSKKDVSDPICPEYLFLSRRFFPLSEISIIVPQKKSDVHIIFKCSTHPAFFLLYNAPQKKICRPLRDVGTATLLLFYRINAP